jgi:hypothetical protein
MLPPQGMTPPGMQNPMANMPHQMPLQQMYANAMQSPRTPWGGGGISGGIQPQMGGPNLQGHFGAAPTMQGRWSSPGSGAAGA